MSDAVLGEQVEMHVDHLSKFSSAEDVLFELLFKAGFPLTTKVRIVEHGGKAGILNRGRSASYLP